MRALAPVVEAEHAGDFHLLRCLVVQEAWILKALCLPQSSLYTERICDINILALPHAL